MSYNFNMTDAQEKAAREAEERERVAYYAEKEKKRKQAEKVRFDKEEAVNFAKRCFL